jgi:hypothetical protein
METGMEKKDTEFCVKGTEYPHTGGTIFIMKKALLLWWLWGASV